MKRLLVDWKEGEGVVCGEKRVDDAMGKSFSRRGEQIQGPAIRDAPMGRHQVEDEGDATT